MSQARPYLVRYRGREGTTKFSPTQTQLAQHLMAYSLPGDVIAARVGTRGYHYVAELEHLGPSPYASTTDLPVHLSWECDGRRGTMICIPGKAALSTTNDATQVTCKRCLKRLARQGA